MHATQKQADDVNDSYNQTQNNHDAQRVTLSLVAVIARIDGVQQVINTAAMNLAYVKLHTTL